MRAPRQEEANVGAARTLRARASAEDARQDRRAPTLIGHLLEASRSAEHLERDQSREQRHQRVELVLHEERLLLDRAVEFTRRPALLAVGERHLVAADAERRRG
jgi:hypothetical protein